MIQDQKIPDKIEICTVEEIEKTRFICKWVDEWRDEIALLFQDGKMIAFSSICPHFGGKLRIKGGGKLQCLWHDWEFDIKTGELLTYDLKTCKVRFFNYKINEKNKVEVLRNGITRI